MQRIAMQALRRAVRPSIARPARSIASTSFRHAPAASSAGPQEQVPASKQPETSPDRTSDPPVQPSDSSSAQASSSSAQAPPAEEAAGSMSEQEKEILEKLEKNFPGGSVAVQDVSGGCGTFFAISVESDRFKGLNRIKQHQLVNRVLEDEVKTWHGMQLKTVAK